MILFFFNITLSRSKGQDGISPRIAIIDDVFFVRLVNSLDNGNMNYANVADNRHTVSGDFKTATVTLIIIKLEHGYTDWSLSLSVTDERASTRYATWNKNIKGELKLVGNYAGVGSQLPKVPFFRVLVLPIAARIPKSSSDRSQRRSTYLPANPRSLSTSPDVS